MSDTYLTLKETAEAQLTEKRSRFLAFALHVDDEAQAKEVATQYKKKYYDARHVCWAYVLGSPPNQTTRAQDDGEPSGTAGRPILGQIVSRQLTYTMVVVVRYFGGVKLGTGPLGVAYKTVAGEALDAAEKETCILRASFRITAPWADADVAMRFVREAGAEITDRDYTATHTVMTVSVRLDDEEALRQRLSKILTLQFPKE
ncbi:MAG: IMPACT family protein [Bacteroidales bacterium]|nr:IMPACT family protein [Bacteroidales bacterium]